MDNKYIGFLKKYLIEIIISSMSFVFSFWLMLSTFSYKNGSMLIATKAWSDFASHIPLIRSFSLGSNFPPQYPIFPGEPIRYHFLFYFFVGMLERAGLRIDWALNLPSALSFFALMLAIYFVAKNLFKSKAVGILSLVFFLFNGSLSFIEFFKSHPLSTNIFTDIITNKTFPSFGPYDGKIVSAFWNLNIYTNQRHLSISYALSLLLIYFFTLPILKKTKPDLRLSMCLGICLGLSFFLHTAVFIMTISVVSLLFFLFPKLRVSAILILTISCIIALPQYFYLQSATSPFKPSIVPGYLISNNLNLLNFLKYWTYNLGLHSILIILGFIFAPKNLKKFFVAYFFLFIIGNSIQFAPDISTNHKFFNYFIIIGSMFSAFFLIKLWKKSLTLKPLAILLFFLIIFSGIIDFFPIYNDSKIQIADYQTSPDIAWIIKNPPPQAVFLNSSFLYNPASLAGRKIFLGWPYFSWGAGYDTGKRGEIRGQLFNPKDLSSFCEMAKQNHLDYAIVNDNQKGDTDLIINHSFFKKNFLLIYENQTNSLIIYRINPPC